MLSPQNFIERPLKLLSFDSLGHLILHQDAIAFISSLTKPISVLCVAGPTSSGKSYLLNSLITKNSSSGFEVGEDSPCTKGLWIWGKPILSTNDKG